MPVLPPSPALVYALAYHRDDGGKPLSINPGSYEAWIYNNLWNKNAVIKSSTQSRKSTMAAAVTFFWAYILLARTFYVLPTASVRNRFVSRLKRLNQNSGFYRDHFPGDQSVGLRTMTAIDGTEIPIAFVGSNSQSAMAEFPADRAVIDEVDFCDQFNLQMVPERLGASSCGALIWRIGNPTIPGSPLDVEYSRSSARLWHIPCPRCERLQHPEWHKNVIDPDTHKPYDREWSEGCGRDIMMLCSNRDCRAELPRNLPGDYIAQNTELVRDEGVHISKLFSGTYRLEQMYLDRFLPGQSNLSLLTRFWNGDMGLEHLVGAVRINLESARVGDHRAAEIHAGPTAMGIDPGGRHWWVIMDMDWRVIAAGSAGSLEELIAVYDRYNAGCAVVDSGAEQELVRKLMQARRGVFRCRYAPVSGLTASEWMQQSADQKKPHTERRFVMTRTAVLDNTKDVVETRLILPEDWRQLAGGDFKAHMESSVRTWDERRAQYVWNEGGKPDHLMHALGYAILARNTYVQSIGAN